MVGFTTYPNLVTYGRKFRIAHDFDGLIHGDSYEFALQNLVNAICGKPYFTDKIYSASIEDDGRLGSVGMAHVKTTLPNVAVFDGDWIVS